ncbi:TIGR02300 family protein [uncultured Sphingomonas sp.]|uniref:TIGR02300 family protein n=1 Tax=uncultured Sphingomonas sp. TaxID=158754 RepID=UPI0035CB8EAB
MIQPEWGTKRQCPKCSTRFYDLHKDEPVACINCGYAWNPEPILKSKQPLAFEQVKAVAKAPDSDLEGEDAELEAIAAGDEGEPSADDEVDLGGDDDLGVETVTEDDEH